MTTYLQVVGEDGEITYRKKGEEELEGTRLTASAREDFKQIAFSFAVNHNSDELMFLSGALEAEAKAVRIQEMVRSR